jgi:hypothetical protein
VLGPGIDKEEHFKTPGSTSELAYKRAIVTDAIEFLSSQKPASKATLAAITQYQLDHRAAAENLLPAEE